MSYISPVLKRMVEDLRIAREKAEKADRERGKSLSSSLASSSTAASAKPLAKPLAAAAAKGKGAKGAPGATGATGFGGVAGFGLDPRDYEEFASKPKPQHDLLAEELLGLYHAQPEEKRAAILQQKALLDAFAKAKDVRDKLKRLRQEEIDKQLARLKQNVANEQRLRTQLDRFRLQIRENRTFYDGSCWLANIVDQLFLDDLPQSQIKSAQQKLRQLAASILDVEEFPDMKEVIQSYIAAATSTEDENKKRYEREGKTYLNDLQEELEQPNSWGNQLLLQFVAEAIRHNLQIYSGSDWVFQESPDAKAVKRPYVIIKPFSVAAQKVADGRKDLLMANLELAHFFSPGFKDKPRDVNDALMTQMWLPPPPRSQDYEKKKRLGPNDEDYQKLWEQLVGPWETTYPQRDDYPRIIRDDKPSVAAASTAATASSSGKKTKGSGSGSGSKERLVLPELDFIDKLAVAYYQQYMTGVNTILTQFETAMRDSNAEVQPSHVRNIRVALGQLPSTVLLQISQKYQFYMVQMQQVVVPQNKERPDQKFQDAVKDQWRRHWHNKYIDKTEGFQLDVDMANGAFQETLPEEKFSLDIRESLKPLVIACWYIVLSNQLEIASIEDGPEATDPIEAPFQVQRSRAVNDSQKPFALVPRIIWATNQGKSGGSRIPVSRGQWLVAKEAKEAKGVKGADISA